MAKYEVTRACGHIATTEDIKPRDKDYRLKKEAEKLCGLCYDEEVKNQRIRESKTASDEATKKGLPKLEGTEKQIAWGETIRKETLEHLENYVTFYYKKPEGFDAINLIKREKSASFWIDNRNLSTYQTESLLKKFTK